MKNLLLLFALFFFLSGCALMDTVVNPQEPVIRLQTARIKDINFDNATLEFDLGILNSNEIDIASTGGKYNLNVCGIPLCKGDIKEKIEIPAYKESTLKLPVQVAYKDIYETIARAKESNSVPYNLMTEIGVDLPVLGEMRIPLTHKGEVPILKRPAISLDGCDIKKFSLSGADMSIGLNVYNPNDVAFNVDAINYALTMNDSSLVKGAQKDGFTIPPLGRKTLQIPVKIDFFSAGSTLVKALRGSDNVDAGVTGDIRLRTTHEMMPEVTVPFEWKGNLLPKR